MKQTAVEWLMEQFFSTKRESSVEEIIEQAKSMEKKRMIEFTNDYVLTQCSASFEGNVIAEMSAEEYYKETFKSE